MEPRSGGERLEEVEPDDPAYLLRPFEAALDDPTRLLQGLESALSDPSEFAQKLEAAIETLGSKLGRQGAADALLATNYLDHSLTDLGNHEQVGRKRQAQAGANYGRCPQDGDQDGFHIAG